MANTLVRCPFCGRIFGLPIAEVRSQLVAHVMKCKQCPEGLSNEQLLTAIEKAMQAKPSV